MSYEKYWAKADKTNPDAWRPFQEHVGAVVLCAEEYLAVRPLLHQRLSHMLELSMKDVLKIVSYAAAYHDLGKLCVGFQAKVAGGFTRTYPSASYELHTTVPTKMTSLGKPGIKADGWNHGVEGYVLWSRKMLQRGEIQAMQPAAWHHGSPPTDDLNDKVQDWWDKIKKKTPDVAAQDEAAVRAFVLSVRSALGPLANDLKKFDTEAVQILAGIISVADWLGSDEESFPLKPDWESRSFHEVYLDQDMRNAAKLRVTPLRAPDVQAATFMPVRPTALQEAIPQHVGDLTIIEAPTGDGKTEAALVAYEALRRLGQVDRMVMCLPTTATTTAMHGRLCRTFETAYPDDPKVHIHHGEMRTLRNLLAAWQGDEDEQGENDSKDFERDWFSSGKRVLLSNASVTTIDQILMTGLAGHRHRFVRQMALATSLVIVDEVHTVDVYMEEVLSHLLEILSACGAKVVLLSATLTDGSRDKLLRAYARGFGTVLPSIPSSARITSLVGNQCSCTAVASRRTTSPVYVFVTTHEWLKVDNVLRPHPDDVRGMLRELVSAVKGGGCVAWIRNTVWDVQALLSFEEEFADVETVFLHASLCAEHRRVAEKKVMDVLGPRGARRPLLVLGTNILGTSLDVDFDRMVVDLTTMDYLIQAAGRLHRHTRVRPHGMDSKVVEVFMPRELSTSSPYEWTHEGKLLPVAKTWSWARQTTVFSDPDDVRSLLELTLYPPEGEIETDRKKVDDVVHDTLARIAEENKSRRIKGRSATTDQTNAAPTRIGRRAVQVVPVRFDGDKVFLPHLSVLPVDVGAILKGNLTSRFDATTHYRKFWWVWRDLSELVQRGGAKRSTLEASSVRCTGTGEQDRRARHLTEAWKNTPSHPRDVIFVAVDEDGVGNVIRDRGDGKVSHYEISYGGDRSGLIVNRIA